MEGMHSIDAKIVLKCWLDGKLCDPNIKSRVSIHDIEDVDCEYGSYIVDTDVTLEIKTDIIYSITENRIISFEVVDIDDDNCPYCSY